MSVAVVLVHGAGADARAWDRLRAELFGLDVVAVDLPGRTATAPAPATSASDAARAVLDGLAARGVRAKDCVVVGHSYGGAVAIECALAAPLAGLVLVSTGARLRVHPGILDAMREDAARGTRSGGAFGWKAGTPPDVIAQYDADATKVPAATAEADWNAANAFDRMSALGAIGCPALVIVGRDDALTPPKYARYLAEHLPHAQLAELEGAGHMCVVDDAPRVAACLAAFVAALPVRGAGR